MKPHLLVASAAVGLVFGSAALARSAGPVTTIPGSMFHAVGTGQMDSSLPGGTWAQTGVTTVFVDGHSTQSGVMMVELYRMSFSGTVTDVATQVSFGTGSWDLNASFPAMGTMPSEWDYYDVLLYNSSPNFNNIWLYGVGAQAK